MYGLLYKLLFFILTILSFFNVKLKNFIKQRMEQSINLEKKDYIWINLSSVGEVNLSYDYIQNLILKTNYKILITVMTDTGMKTAQKKYGNRNNVKILYFPLDNIKIIKSIINKINLKLLILIETEIWPNLIEQSSKVCKILIVNGRISDGSFKQYKKLKIIFKKYIRMIDLYLMQTEMDATRIIKIGANKENVKIMGNLKYELKIENYDKKELEKFKKELGLDGRKVIALGSTHEKEEEFFLKFINRYKSYIFILVPRHVDRRESIIKRLKEMKIEYSDYNENQKITKENNIILICEMGILRKVYAISDICFVGGTLDNTGGHNILEPLYFNKISVFGPNLSNVREMSTELISKNLGLKFTKEEKFKEIISKNYDNKQETIIKLFEENKNAKKIAIEETLKTMN